MILAGYLMMLILSLTSESCAGLRLVGAALLTIAISLGLVL